MIRYLLGEMSIEEQIAMETGYFTDPEKFNLLQVVEHDLIEGYINGKLSASGRVKFEQHFLRTPARREQVRFFETLAKVVPFEIDQQVPERMPIRAAALESIDLGQKSSWWESILAPFRGPRLALGMSFAAAMLILAVAGTWLIVGNREQDNGQIANVNPPASPDHGQASNPGPQKESGQQPQEADIKREKPEPPSAPKPEPKPVIASFIFTIVGTRQGATPQVLRIPPNTDSVQLTFNHREAPYSRYRVSLENLSGGQVWSRSDVKVSRGKSETSLILNVPAKQFNEGSYSLVVRRNNAAGELVVVQEFIINVER
jgi:hypothetical protein